MKENALDLKKENPTEKRMMGVLSVIKDSGGRKSRKKISGPKNPKRIRPWQREGFSSKKEWSLMRKRINKIIWKNREVA